MGIALTIDDAEVVAAERRGYERAMRQIVERGSNIGADWDGLSEEVEIMLRVAAGERFVEDREREQLEAEVELELLRIRKPFFERVMRHLSDLLEGSEPGLPVGRIERDCRDYSLRVEQLLERLREYGAPLQKFELFRKPAPSLPDPLEADMNTLLVHVAHDGMEAYARLRALLVKLNSFGPLKY
jgi:hypothetical protein